jgi:hypothetical protein
MTECGHQNKPHARTLSRGAHVVADEKAPDAVDAWQAPSWCEASIEYHKARDGRRAVLEIEPERLKRLRRLMLDNVSLNRAYHELNQGGGQAPAALVEALMFSLRLGIIDGLARPGAKERLSRLSEEQLRAVCDRLRNFKPQIAKAWTAEEIGALVIIWSHLK